MDEHWETLTFGDLVPGDVVRLDEEGPEETVRTIDRTLLVRGIGTIHRLLIRTDLNVRFHAQLAPVLVRFPRPEAAS